ncbi:MAG: ABC-type uncharacterized transport system substrate-binding protein [Oleiphilaceae bacterium]|jgi:ABC-type uncharacterized transport system substrate-binding protein
MKLRNHYLIIAMNLIVLCLSARIVQAHPNNWITLNSSFVLNDQTHLVQIKQRWEFDIYYSMMTLADVLNEYENEAVGLPKIAEAMIRNLKSYRYYSVLSLNGATIDLGVPDKYSIIKKESGGQIVLELEMVFDIEDSLPVENKILAWQVYDPTYFIAMNHTTKNNIEIVGGSAVECSKTLELSKPSDELIGYAESLDRTDKNTDDLGASFAETVFIKCV